MTAHILFLRDPALQGLMRSAAEVLREDGSTITFAKRKLRWGSAGQTTVEIADRVLVPATIIVAGPGSPVTREMMVAASRLEALVAPAAGCDAFDVDYATEQGIVVAHGATQAQYDSMAEGTIALMLALLYRLTWAERSLRAGWQSETPRLSWMLQGKTVGLLGYGPIARGVAARLAGWGCRLICWTRSRPSGSRENAVEFVSLDDLLTGSDILSVHLRHVPETERLLDGARLARMKPGALLVNTARGAVIDEVALAGSLRDGPMIGAALDAFAIEPLNMESPLRQLKNVILTPHNICHTEELWNSIRDTLIENLRRITRRQAPVITKNPQVLDWWLAASKLTAASGSQIRQPLSG